MKKISILLVLFSVSMAFGAAEAPKEKEKETTETASGAAEMSLDKKMKKAALESKLANVRRIFDYADYLSKPENITILQLKTPEYDKFFEVITMIWNKASNKLSELQTDINVLLGKAKPVSRGGLFGGFGSGLISGLKPLTKEKK